AFSDCLTSHVKGEAHRRCAMRKIIVSAPFLLACAVASSLPANADSLIFSSGAPDGLMAAASRPESAGKNEIETGDDFVVTGETSITCAFSGPSYWVGHRPLILARLLLKSTGYFPPIQMWAAPAAHLHLAPRKCLCASIRPRTSLLPPATHLHRQGILPSP